MGKYIKFGIYGYAAIGIFFLFLHVIGVIDSGIFRSFAPLVIAFNLFLLVVTSALKRKGLF